MAKLKIEKQIDAPLDRVFAAATDLRNAPETVSGITRLEVLTDGPIGLGTRFRETRVMFGKEATEEMEITEFKPPHGYSVGCENHGCRYHSEFRFSPTDNGTKVEMTFAAQPLTLTAKVMSFVMAPLLKSCLKAMEQDLEDIKSSLEAEVAGL